MNIGLKYQIQNFRAISRKIAKLDEGLAVLKRPDPWGLVNDTAKLEHM